MTLCAKNRECFLGDVVNGKMQLSAIGYVAERCWREIPDHCKNVRIDEYVVMPNHVHGILVIERRLDDDGDNGYPIAERRQVETFHGTSLPDGDRQRHGEDHQIREKISSPNGSLSLSKTMSAISPKRGSLGAIVRSYKSSVTRWCRQNGYSHVAWQPRFYERIIWADGSIDYIRRYIRNNPRNWQRDRNNPKKSPPPTSSPPITSSPTPPSW
ncbi:transposase [Leptolyngbya ectocarpi]|uniref:transposase n=1 Tax=Leptolyngbya ectocarpi TaxID=1202 RepID=UPI002AD383D2|nr:transposase [Leptolyngbya ectocarpi]